MNEEKKNSFLAGKILVWIHIWREKLLFQLKSEKFFDLKNTLKQSNFF